MDLITTHINSDFDGLGSLIAAKKLFPNSRLLLPGSQERAVRMFMTLIQDVIKIETERSCQLDDIDRLIIVDTRHPSRIGVADGLLKKKGIKVYIYDHHPRTEGDIVPHKDVYEEVGSTVTILVKRIQQKKIDISSLEATIMALGIYEETGMLTYRTTTKEDVDAVSFLLSKGANLNVVSSYLNRELTKEELAFLIELIHRIYTIDINGIEVSFVEADIKGYDGELSMVVHKIVDMENIKVLFFLAKSRQRIRIIARSRIPQVDVNKILSHFGGGGHTAAATALVQEQRPELLKSCIIKLLKRYIKIRHIASDIMEKEIVFYSSNQKVSDVLLSMEDKGIKNAPVFWRHRMVGIVSRQSLLLAKRRGLGHSRIKGLMHTKFATVSPDDSLSDIQKIMFERNQGIVPVIQDGHKKPIGIISRTALLKALYGELFLSGDEDVEFKRPIPKPFNLSDRMREVLPPSLIRLINSISTEAQIKSVNIFLVGGFVRDIIMGVKNLDLDIVLEGDAIEFSRYLIKKFGGNCIYHRRFGTCTLTIPWNLKGGRKKTDYVKIDMATARKEVYITPASLPKVSFSSVKEDLARRDFTINAMAISLNKKNFGQLLDFYGGQKDIEKKRIRVLHNESFIDDPTRIFRAVRFEQRLGFRIEPHTERLIADAVKRRMLHRTEKQRLRDELILILYEDDPIKMIRRMAELHELEFIHPSLRYTKKLEHLLYEVKDVIAWFRLCYLKKRALDVWIVYFMALLDGLTVEQTRMVCQEFVFRKGDTKRILSYKTDGQTALTQIGKKNKVKPSHIYKSLHPLSYETILILMAKSGLKYVRRRIAEFLTKYNEVSLKINGNDLQRLGLKEGPHFKELLLQTLYAKLDKGLKSKKDELSYVRTLLKRKRIKI